MGTKSRILGIAAAVAASTALFAAPAQARGVVNFSIGVPLYTQPSYVYSQPAYVYPQPAYGYAQPAYVYPQPSYVYAPPSYVYPQPGVSLVIGGGFGGHRYYHRGYAPRFVHHHR
jgi:hypothetical protein